MNRITVACAAFAALCLVPCGAQSAGGTVVDKAAAVVNGEAILQSEYDRIVKQVMDMYRQSTPPAGQSEEKVREIRQKVLTQMVDDKILVQEATRNKIKINKREMDQGLAEVRGRFGSEKEFTEALESEGLTRAAFDKRIEQQLMVMKLTNQEIKGKVTPPTDAEISSLYGKIQDKMAGKDLKMAKADEDEIGYLAKIFKRAGSEQARARHILLSIAKGASDKEKAAVLDKIRKIRAEIKAGADFSEAAKKYSEDSATKDRGGDLGMFALGDMVPEFEKAVFALNVGEMSEPVLTQYGYHLIRVETKQASRVLSLDDVKGDLREFLGQKAAQKRYEEWFKNIKSKASIKINEM